MEGVDKRKSSYLGYRLKGEFPELLRVVEWRELSGGSCVDFTPNL